MLVVVGLLNPLDSPHHMRFNDISTYREGVVLDKPVKDGRGSFVNVGLGKVAIGSISFTLYKVNHFEMNITLHYIIPTLFDKVIIIL